jgi:TRAP-type C4-dicarboxylate transport system permease small subunit
VMMVLVVVEIVCRTLFGVSLQLSDELGGYLLVTIAFLSLPVTQEAGAFHRVTFLHDRLPPRGRAALTMVLELMSLLFLLVVLWQLWRLEIGSWVRADQSDTLLAMPLWAPRLPMVLGIAALSITIGRGVVLAWRDCRTPAG